MKDFKESLDTAVFTTTYVMKNHSPVLFVYHFDDGSWQFSGIENDIRDEVMMVVGLGEIIKMDSTLLDIADLQSGFEAIRNDRSSPWKILESN